MDNGLVRFTATKVNELEEIYLEHGLPELDKSWLAQAYHLFGQLQIHPDEWKDYAMLSDFNMLLTRSSPPEELNVPPEVYLFILPIPQPSDDEGIWRSWVEGEKYFWSFDPFGREKISDFELATSGIPSFTSTINAIGRTWSPSDYDIIRKLQVFKGFDPTTTDLAVATGCPILEVIDDDDRFEDFEEPSFDMLPPRRSTVKHPSRASTSWSNRKSRTKNVGAADAKIMKSSRRVRTSSKQRVKSQTTGSWSRAERLRKQRRSIKNLKDRGQ
ncbi:hypothetical protein VNI00_010555 [Paramarasmius palmivorus]|uniref:Uncharacterized protein n=1 Tax=Paramarasmius palmivorus TaxID=297713 RepID=A0AAW0CJ17_9AGAR